MLAPRQKLWSTPGEGIVVACDLLELSSSDVVYDVGCGDGRFLVEACRRGATCVGLEIDATRAAEARSNLASAGFSGLGTVKAENALECDFAGATCFYLYLIPRGLKIVAPLLLKLAKTRPLRVVTYMAPLPGVGLCGTQIFNYTSM